VCLEGEDRVLVSQCSAPTAGATAIALRGSRSVDTFFSCTTMAYLSAKHARQNAAHSALQLRFGGRDHASRNLVLQAQAVPGGSG
jgi:hypothetical protein